VILGLYVLLAVAQGAAAGVFLTVSKIYHQLNNIRAAFNVVTTTSAPIITLSTFSK
jgi:hypothetical protein